MLYEITVVVTALIVFPLTTRALGAKGYGKYSTFYVIAGFALTWVYASGGASLVQLFLQRRRTIASGLRVGRRQVIALAVPTAIIGLIISVHILGTGIVVPALLVFCSDLIIAGLAEMNISAVYAIRGTSASARLRMIAPIMKCAGVVLLVVVGHASILTLVINNLIGSVAMLVASTYALSKVAAADRRANQTPTSARELLRLSTVYALSISAYSVQNDLDKIVLASFRSSTEVGEYNAAYRVMTTAMLPLRSVSTAASRWFLPDDDPDGSHLRKAARLMIPTGAYGVLCGLGLILCQPITRLLVGSGFEDSVEITLWLAAFPLLRTASDAPYLGLLGLGRNRVRMYLGFAGALIATSLYFTMIPAWGWKGAVLATYTSEVFTVVGGWTLLVRCQRQRDRERAHLARAAVVTPASA
ncbi:MAG: oligosaccharide flippase family protein [Ilumatobacteraceae bacterium]